VALQDDGRIVAVGSAVSPEERIKFAVVRYHAGGRLDPTFGGDGKVTTAVGDEGRAEDVAIQPDERIVAAGRARVPSGRLKFAVARYLSA
jgi:uncharacterized delta-60 repeat protein